MYLLTQLIKIMIIIAGGTIFSRSFPGQQVIWEPGQRQSFSGSISFVKSAMKFGEERGVRIFNNITQRKIEHN